jgi:hypothetical protein
MVSGKKHRAWGIGERQQAADSQQRTAGMKNLEY